MGGTAVVMQREGLGEMQRIGVTCARISFSVQRPCFICAAFAQLDFWVVFFQRFSCKIARGECEGKCRHQLAKYLALALKHEVFFSFSALQCFLVQITTLSLVRYKNDLRKSLSKATLWAFIICLCWQTPALESASCLLSSMPSWGISNVPSETFSCFPDQGHILPN